MSDGSVTARSDTREELLERGHARVSEVGLQGLTLGRLAREVGISKAGIYAHFDSKEQLLREVLARAVDLFVSEGVEPALREPPGEPKLRALFEAWLEWTEASPVPGGCIFISSAVELDDRPGPLRDYLVDVQRRWSETLERAAAEARERGHLREDLDPGQLVFEVHAIVLGFHYFLRLFGDEAARARARYAFESLVARARAREGPTGSRPA